MNWLRERFIAIAHASASRLSRSTARRSQKRRSKRTVGHEKDAFTGALTQKLGKLEAANGGRVFLDDIGDAGADASEKLVLARRA